MKFSANQARGVLVLLAAVSLIWMFVSRRMDPVMVTDSTGYTEFDWSSAQSILSNHRTFVYPLFIRIVRGIGTDRLIPLMHWLALMIAATVFHEGLVAAGYRRFPAIWAAGVLMFGHTVMEHGPVVATDSLACSSAIAAAGCFLGSSGVKTSKGWWGGLGLLTFLSYQTRPAFLFLIALWPSVSLLIDWLILRRRDDWKTLFRRCAIYAAITTIPFVGFCTIRLCLVGHWGLVSFGGYNLIGIVGQFLDQTSIERMPAELKPVAASMLDRLNRQKDYEAPSSFLAMERMYNPTVWEAAVPSVQEIHGENPRVVNAVLSQLSSGLLRQHRRQYVQWLVWNGMHGVKQIVRMVASDFGARLVVVILLIALAASLAWGPGRPLPTNHQTATHPTDTSCSGNWFLEVHLLFWTAAAFATAKWLLVVLVEPANDRYMSAAMVLLPAALGVFAALCFEPLVLRKSYSSPEIPQQNAES